MLKMLLLAIIVGIAVLLVLASMKPDAFRVARSIHIKAPPEKIFPYVSDLHAFTSWSPYEKKDPAMKKIFSEPSSGKGASYDWEGDSNVGKGRLEVADVEPPSKVRFKLDMFTPIEAHNTVDFTFVPAGDGTDVTWAMNGNSPFLAKIMHVIFNMDRMVGKDFEDGLASLKHLAEAS